MATERNLLEGSLHLLGIDGQGTEHTGGNLNTVLGGFHCVKHCFGALLQLESLLILQDIKADRVRRGDEGT